MYAHSYVYKQSPAPPPKNPQVLGHIRPFFERKHHPCHESKSVVLCFEGTKLGGFFRICRFIPFDKTNLPWKLISKERTPRDLSPQWDMNDQRWVAFFCWAPLGSDVFSWSIHCTTKSIWSSKKKYTLSIPTANEFLFLCIFWEAIKSLPAKKWQQNNKTTITVITTCS